MKQILDSIPLLAAIYVIALVHEYGIAPLLAKIGRWIRKEEPIVQGAIQKELNDFAAMVQGLRGQAKKGAVVSITDPNGTVLTMAPATAPPPPLLVSIAPADFVATALKASSAAGYVHGLSWNQLAWLKSLDAKAFADWCAGVAAQPLCAAPDGTPGDSLGWITHLNDAGQSILAAVANTGIKIPDTDPRL